jgi:bifunctional enzyme Fae/Hps
VEAGTPFLKQEGRRGLETIAALWPGYIVADLKISDGAAAEIHFAKHAGAHAATALGSAPKETLELFVETCRATGLDSMIDMLGVADPLRILAQLRQAPDVVILHIGRDEESARGKSIPYRHVNKIKSKFDVLISAAGGIGLKEARSAIFNGANIVVANVVAEADPWKGIAAQGDLAAIAKQFLKTIE